MAKCTTSRGRSQDESTTRHFNATYDLQPGSPLASSFVIQTRTKCVIPKLYPTPPPFPSFPSRPESAAWRAMAHRFARYALVLHRPWDVTTRAPTRLNWTAFISFIADCKTGVPGVIGTFDSRTRYHWIASIAAPLAAGKATKAAIFAHRGSARTIWGEVGVANPDAIFDRGLRLKAPRTGEGDNDCPREAMTDRQRRNACLIMAQLHEVQDEDKVARVAASNAKCVVTLSADPLTAPAVLRDTLNRCACPSISAPSPSRLAQTSSVSDTNAPLSRPPVCSGGTCSRCGHPWGSTTAGP